MSSSHYFTSDAAQPEQRRRLNLQLAGRQLSVRTSAGIFSPEGIDKGTQALLAAVPEPPAAGDFLDIGCGWGPLALTMALLSPQARVLGVEVNQVARELCAENAAQLGLRGVEVAAPEQVSRDRQFDLIWSNPPIRIGKPALHELLARWLPQLKPSGSAWLVVHKHLGADSLLPWMRSMLSEFSADFSVERAATAKGFRIIRISREAQ